MPRLKKSAGLSDAAYAELQSWLLDRKLTLENVQTMLVEKHGMRIAVSGLHQERMDVQEATAIIKGSQSFTSAVLAEVGEFGSVEASRVAQHFINVAMHRTARAVAMGNQVSPGEVQKLAKAHLDMTNALSKSMSNEERAQERANARAELLKEQSQTLNDERTRGVLTPEQDQFFREKLGLA